MGTTKSFKAGKCHPDGTFDVAFNGKNYVAERIVPKKGQSIGDAAIDMINARFGSVENLMAAAKKNKETP